MVPVELSKKIAPEETQARTINQYALMLTFSFMIGQGSKNPQYDALLYAKGRNPNLRIAEDVFKPVELATRTLIYPQFFPHGVSEKYDTAFAEGSTLHSYHNGTGGLFTKESINKEISKDLKKMQEIFDEPPVDPETLLPGIAMNLFRKDYKYLVDPGKGRPKRTRAESDKSFFTDPWGSFLIEFIMRGRRTGIPEFNRMLDDVTSYIGTQREENTEVWITEMEPKLMKIIKSHNYHHADDQFIDAELVSTHSVGS